MNIFMGYEDILYELTAEDGNVIRLTKDHPVLTEEGLVQAEFATEGTKIMRAEGHLKEIISARKLEGHFAVYNLQLESEENLFEEEGFIVGDIMVQNDIRIG